MFSRCLCGPAAAAGGTGPVNLSAVTASAIASYILAVTFAWAGIAKLVGFSRWRAALEGFGLAGPARRAALVGVPVAELVVAVLLVVGLREVGAALALALLAAFSGAILVAARAKGARLPCGCFGGAKERDYRWMLVRNGALAVLAAVVLLGREIRPSLFDSSIEAVPLALSVAGALVISWTVWQVISSLRGRRQQ
jgi:uncharacterized membrane protein YphA (DoxX/SURF4 family)